MSASLRIAVGTVALATLALATLAFPAAFASAAPSAASRGSGACAVHAGGAARRSGLSAEIILRVMHAESRGNPRALSHKGAIGCMQIMPATWSELTGRYRLGNDPWNPRLNMIGGALYLAELVRQFGLPGAYAAYNAGPGRYRRHVHRGVPLPAETVAYTARLTGGVAVRDRGRAVNAIDKAPRWQEAGLFIASPVTSDTGADREQRDPVDLSATGPRDARNALFPLVRSDGSIGRATSVPNQRDN